MRPVAFKETNLMLGAGGNPNTEAMPVAVCTASMDNQEVPMVVSCWKPTAEELARIAETGVIWVATMGYPPPPILITDKNPITELGYVPVEIQLK